VEQQTAHAYEAPDVAGPGVAWLAETADPLWRAELDERDLAPQDAGWGNAFRLPEAEGELDIAYPRTGPYIAWLILFAIGWIVVIGGAFSRSRRPSARAGRRS
jgi:hypothetical protein